MSSEGSALEKARFMAYGYFKFPVHKFQMLKALKIHYEGKVKKNHYITCLLYVFTNCFVFFVL